MPPPSDHPIVHAVRDAIVDTLGDALLGLYLYGSLATGDFEPAASDIDLIAVLTDEPDAALVERLASMHAGVVRRCPGWDDRIEVDYVSASGLAACRTETTAIARISPGEPMHLVHAGRDFILDWYPARRDGIALVGPSIVTVIPPIPRREYLDEVRAYLLAFRHRFDTDATPGSQAYAILTMCRGLYTIRSGERLSKRAAATRVREAFPRWSELIDRALGWRDRQWSPGQPDGSGSVADTRAFIAELAGILESSPRPFEEITRDRE